jgi:Zn-dependent M28 family amino/carboxypeptidase
MNSRWVATVAVLSAAVIAIAGCHKDPKAASPPGTDYAKQLQGQVSVDAVMGHLQQLQDIANAHGGTRQTGTPGYDASVDYVVKTLKDKGFDVQTPDFEMGVFSVGAESLTVNGAPVAATAIDYSGAAPAPGVTGPLVVIPSDDTPGCEATDYDGLPVAGAIVVVDRGACLLADKAKAATERGAAGIVIANNAEEKVFSGGMEESDAIKIPVVSVSKADGATLRTETGTATLIVDARVDHTKVRNVIAQTKTGSTQNVVVVGGHLDSVRMGPGINDDGSGVAAILQTALQMGSSPAVQNAVRFAFWGGEEECLCGSADYVKSLDIEALKDVALYLNFDMIGSPNPGYFTLDGDISTRPDPENGLVVIPEGSAGIERALVSYLKSVGKTAQDTPFDDRGDYDSFARAGIPAGDMFTGAELAKTPEQAKLWGGEADKPFDQNYHSADDTIKNVDRAALDITVPGVAYAVGLYAQDQSGRFGVPIREDRTRHQLEDA